MDACAIRAGKCSSFIYAQYIQLPMDSSIITKECNQGLIESPKPFQLIHPWSNVAASPQLKVELDYSFLQSYTQ